MLLIHGVQIGRFNFSRPLSLSRQGTGWPPKATIPFPLSAPSTTSGTPH